jgi:hypothetical protein
MLITGAIAIGLAATQDLVVLKGPLAEIGVGRHLGLGVQLTGTADEDSLTQPLLFASAAWIAFFGLLLLATRVRFLGLLWRLLALLGVVAPVALAVNDWLFIHDPVDYLASDENVAVRAALRLGHGVVEALGGGASAGLGLYLLTLGAVMAVIGLLVPPIHRDVAVETQPQGWAPA